MNVKRLPKITLRITRDGILFVVGLLGIGYETLIANGDRPTLLVMFGAMVGLPAFLRTDEKKKLAPVPPLTPPSTQAPSEQKVPEPPAPPESE